jgi:hypothetical protein
VWQGLCRCYEVSRWWWSLRCGTGPAWDGAGALGGSLQGRARREERWTRRRRRHLVSCAAGFGNDRHTTSASSSRSRLPVRHAVALAMSTCPAPSVGILWRPPLATAVVTHLVTQLSADGVDHPQPLLLAEEGPPARCPRHVPSIAARAPTVPRQYANARSSCRDCGRSYSNLLIRSLWRRGR